MWPNPQETMDLVIYIEEIFDGKLDFFCSVEYSDQFKYSFSVINTEPLF